MREEETFRPLSFCDNYALQAQTLFADLINTVLFVNCANLCKMSLQRCLNSCFISSTLIIPDIQDVGRVKDENLSDDKAHFNTLPLIWCVHLVQTRKI